jgi:hypothetical protein
MLRLKRAGSIARRSTIESGPGCHFGTVLWRTVDDHDRVRTRLPFTRRPSRTSIAQKPRIVIDNGSMAYRDNGRPAHPAITVDRRRRSRDGPLVQVSLRVAERTRIRSLRRAPGYGLTWTAGRLRASRCGDRAPRDARSARPRIRCTKGLAPRATGTRGREVVSGCRLRSLSLWARDDTAST